ncbi:MAG: histidine phosphatase family protein [Myxococcales bacterium]|nr:histidine phosphatase family protein [Myxococcales bacterium]
MIPEGRELPKHILVMVGLPARGKTYIARKIARYLSWLGYDTRTFNVGEYRRSQVGARQPASFFDHSDERNTELREGIAMRALDDVLEWLAGGGEVAIYDATNTEKSRRDIIWNRCRAVGVQVVFVESICEDEAVVEANVRDNKLRSPDYADVDPEEAVRDFRARIAAYERTYEPVDEPERSYVKIIDVGRQVVVNHMEGYFSARLMFFLMNVHPGRRKIWLTRHGESLFNTSDRIGGDSNLSPRGFAYARSLAEFMRQQPGTDRLVVWTSTLKRAIQTAAELGIRPIARRALDEIDAGVCDGMTYDEIKQNLPDEYRARVGNKFRYRYPRGESYADVILRLEPVIVDIERQRQPILLVGHQAIIRALYGYLTGRPQEECPHVPIPLHTLIELTPTAYGYEEHRVELEPDLPDRSDAPLSMGPWPQG